MALLPVYDSTFYFQHHFASCLGTFTLAIHSTANLSWWFFGLVYTLGTMMRRKEEVWAIASHVYYTRTDHTIIQLVLQLQQDCWIMTILELMGMYTNNDTGIHRVHSRLREPQFFSCSCWSTISYSQPFLRQYHTLLGVAATAEAVELFEEVSNGNVTM